MKNSNEYWTTQDHIGILFAYYSIVFIIVAYTICSLIVYLHTSISESENYSLLNIRHIVSKDVISNNISNIIEFKCIPIDVVSSNELADGSTIISRNVETIYSLIVYSTAIPYFYNFSQSKNN